MIDNASGIPLPSEASCQRAVEYGQLIDEIKQSPGANFELRLYEKKFHLYPFLKNAHELERLIQQIESQICGEMFQPGGDEQEMHVFSLELVRLLFNVVMSAMMLVDYTRTFMKKNYSGTSVIDQYQELIKNTVAADPLCLFVQGLRNLATHVGNPDQHILRKRTRESVSTIVLFNHEGLLSRFDDWKPEAKELIQEEAKNPEEFSVKRIMRGYRAIIDGLKAVGLLEPIEAVTQLVTVCPVPKDART